MIKKLIKTLYLLIFILTPFIFFSCKKEVEEDPNVRYTCSMDPQVKETKPGKCPICKMDLAKTEINLDKKSQGLKLSETQIKLANIQTAKVSHDSASENLMLRGTLVLDQKKIHVLSSRVPGRIERLYVKTPGTLVQMGNRIYDIYSEELEAAIKQYLLLKEKAEEIKGGNVNYKQLLKAAEDKLIIWGLSHYQIYNLSTSENTHVVPFYSQENGIVDEIFINEGDYVGEGTPILKTAELSTLWVEAEAYHSDLEYLKAGKEVQVRIEAFPTEVVEGKIIFQNPELIGDSKITYVNIKINNKQKKYKPGMRVTVTIPVKERKILAVPESAILYQPNMNVAWIRNEDGSFSHRMVELGIRNKNKVQIKNGLKEGDDVVVFGAYLINSEYLLRQGSSSMANMPGMENMEGMEDMKDMKNMEHKP